MTAFNPCLVIPAYNHSTALSQVIVRAETIGLPCLVVDDGSDTANRNQLDEIASQYPWVSIVRYETNRGKGAAVISGLRKAFDQGYSHALQIDADGQHALEDIPRFLEAAQQSPEAVITGRRVSVDAPKSRHYGRMLTDGLVWLETLSTSIHDSMCGFRVYPLGRTLAMLKHHRIGQRMDFDTDMLVKLYWFGLDVQEIQTTVIYRPDIPSHFRMLRDNVRMTRLHISLIIGMLFRIPSLLKRKRQARYAQV